MDEKNQSKWMGKYKNLQEYYQKEYNPEYFEFDKYELEIDPDESFEEIEKYNSAKQQKEIITCANSFFYFCHKYVRILHPERGLVPFILYKYQRRVIHDYENNRFTIISKFRQGGLTTVTLIWSLWQCLFKLDKQVMTLSKTDHDATDIGLIIERAVDYFPEWLKPNKNNGKWNDHHKQFSDTGGSLRFHSPESARGKAMTLLIVDEAAFVSDMERHWKAIWPTISAGGRCIVISTVNGLGNWYEQTYHTAKDGKSFFHVIDLDYWEHPEYNNEKWVKLQKVQLGEKGWLQEVMRSFLGSGETYIPAHIIGELDTQTRNLIPLRILFPKWSNKNADIKVLDDINYEIGALSIWKEPVDGHEYIIGGDCAEGVGNDGDNSCFEVIDSATLEQVAEFYSNLIPPHFFAQVLYELGIYYNNALIIVEDMASGAAVLNNLQNELFYENLYYEPKKDKPGIKMSRTNRPLILESLQRRLLNGAIRINSKKLVSELKTFQYNSRSKKAEAQPGKHDDAIMAICLTLFIRDSVLRNVPVGVEIPTEITAGIRTDIYEEIKRELMENAPKNWLEEDVDLLEINRQEVLSGIVFNVQRNKENIVKEFGW
jgi:hypothetical protein